MGIWRGGGTYSPPKKRTCFAWQFFRRKFPFMALSSSCIANGCQSPLLRYVRLPSITFFDALKMRKPSWNRCYKKVVMPSILIHDKAYAKTHVF